MRDRKLDAVGCGSMVVDFFHHTPRIIGADEKILTDAAGLRPAAPAVGGVTLNHLGWARVLGLNVGIFGKMGDDRNGELLRAGMNALGIRHHLTLDGSASSSATIFVDPDGNRAIYMVRGATAELRPAEVRRRHAAFFRTAHLATTEISQLPLATVVAILEFARAQAIPTLLDVDVPPSDALATLGAQADLERALSLATYLKPAKAAARELAAGSREPLRMAETIRARYGNRAVVITDGERGCAIAAAGAAVRVPAFRIRQIDATGAGDAFLGGMLAGLRWGLDWPAIGRLANATGAVCAAHPGGFPSGFERRAEILSLLGENIPQAAQTSSDIPAAHADGSEPFGEVASFFDLCLAEMGELRDAIDLRAIGRAVEAIRGAAADGGRVHVTGVGKPEHVARYAASILCSVGTMATFLHATETLHGSLGQVDPRDIVIAISNSGETAELCAAARAIRDHGARLIAITGGRDSALARLADVVIHAPVDREGGLLGLAPRISVLGQVMVVAALSVALEAARGLTLEEYSRWHQAGALGDAARRLAARHVQAGPEDGSKTPRGLTLIGGRRRRPLGDSR
jgi:sugar/nucleoside kinase (ribokinase family)/D-arabinose 5-phosphate isomerase GutQ